ncbi:beta strand repeat-containing protein [Gloeobacter morelensis]|uniref:SBBP repeat-containing protein n=1 Tax=Gloeobacter morelensis MG652769 TaxID=2781736 RepID=A0ABY3PGD4_9CYAN|nr:FG-GAP-like repeat-containing protein [Gloeobacter morelensis]UFP92726.1 SBBP repeat-containing protein [Gloeobacter morelensis MG652769]
MLSAVALLATLLPIGAHITQARTATERLSPDTQARIGETFGKLPMRFEPNVGQTDSRVQYVSRGPGYSLLLGPTEAVMLLGTPDRSKSKLRSSMTAAERSEPKTAAIRMNLVGANPKARLAGKDVLPGKVNYLAGKDTGRWRTDVDTFERVEARGVWPGIDMVYYGNGRQLEYDFVVGPGVDPGRIAMDVAGARSLRLDGNGDLIIATALGEIRQHRPVVYQQIGGQKRQVAGRYVLNGRKVSFAVGEYDRSLPLVIDPILSYSTFAGGAEQDVGNDIVLGSDGSVYITGYTLSTSYPAVSAYDSSYAGGTEFGDIFITKLNAAGSQLVYSTYLGGTGDDFGSDIAVRENEAYVIGSTASTDFPTTTNAYDTSYGGGTYDAFVAKLNAAGNGLVYSTYLGGTLEDNGNGIVVGGGGAAYITGNTGSFDFPVTDGTADTTFNGGSDMFVTRLGAAGDALVYSTFTGGTLADSGNDIVQGSNDSVYVVGTTSGAGFPVTPNPGVYDVSFNGGGFDAVVTRFNSAGGRIYSTYLGGVGQDSGNAIALGSDGSVYVTGSTASSDFPTTSGAYDTSYNLLPDVFVTRLNAGATALVYSTFLGGALGDVGLGIVLDSAGNAYITGSTLSTNFPVTFGAYDTSYNGGTSFGDVFVSKLNALGDRLLYSTFIGGATDDYGSSIVVGSGGRIFITGATASIKYPTTSGAYDTSFDAATDVFISRFLVPVDGDFGANDNADIVWRNFGSGANTVWGMNGTAFSASVPLETVGDLNWRIGGTDDFNADGKLDILWRNQATGQNSVWLMDGTTRTGTATLTAVADLNWQIQGSGDYTGDGKPDILWRNFTTGANTIWKMNGTDFVESIALPAVSDPNWRIGGSADFTGDSKPDILWRNQATGANTVWTMDGTAFVASVTISSVADLNWRIGGTADYNRDGKPDILWRNYATGANSIWIMNGTTFVSSVALQAVSDLNWEIQAPR